MLDKSIIYALLAFLLFVAIAISFVILVKHDSQQAYERTGTYGDVNNVMANYPCLKKSGWQPQQLVYGNLYLAQLEENCILRGRN